MAANKLDSICADDCPYRYRDHVDISYPTPKAEAFKRNHTLQRQEILNLQAHLESKPTIMSVVPTVKCNLDCVMCYLDHRDTVELPANIQTTLKKYFPIMQELWIVGGEPLISQTCLEIIESIDSELYPDLHLGLITNGTVVTEEIVALLLHKRIGWVLVSIDAATPETYRKIRGGSFGKAIEGVRQLQSIKVRQDADWNLKIGFTIMRSNMYEVFSFVDLAEKLEVDCQFSPVFGQGHGESFYDDPAAVESVKRIISQLGDYLESKRFDRIKTSRVLARLKLNSSDSFFDGDDPVDFDTWRRMYTTHFTSIE